MNEIECRFCGKLIDSTGEIGLGPSPPEDDKPGDVPMHVECARCARQGLTATRNTARLRLERAAPELLAACKKALHLVEENNEEIVQMVGSFGLLRDLTEAIAKAETT